ncbi:myo-inositol 2-dehydrogenase/D-chiro-inositol 1-dehydrogenase [Kribbella antiqua]|uniref:Inositol 2-dehydrogenase n=1 Tax=Kribbella antiqua TaxID=2512217 RepID=A0A4R2IX19_9ACTN|nr:Gfo/Idh/MocA family oxidoreductase [Kribbella antiqua]TCO50341.1 myo-inositol 2-dehydrogenase/D-chiro-inositol 1-dehydrogenase [Kribbella antiqua]
MTLSIGVIGTGMIGTEHIRRISQVLSGAEITAVTDVNLDAAKQVAGDLPDAEVFDSGQELIRSGRVDAVLVTSWGPTHEEFVLASIAAGKPVFCEKPLATTAEACRRIIAAEVAAGRRLVQVGFMRRYDASYRELKARIDSGEVGAPLICYSAHRNPSVGESYTSEMAIVDTAVHDFDVTRWLLGEEFTAIRVVPAKQNSLGGGLRDPLLMVVETESGVLVNVETSVNIRYGYDIRGEVVGESGAAALAASSPALADWRERFSAAFDTEFQEWIDTASQPIGPSAWDGYAATVVCDAGVRSLETGERVAVVLGDKPALYEGTPE